jgi:phospho-N-acetylmuramoyl-pentapeptide-transferase
MELLVLAKIFALATLAFVVAIAWEPALTRFLLRYKLGKSIRDAETAPIMSAMHAKKAGTPSLGGLLIWVTAAGILVALHLANLAFGGKWLGLFDFYSRNETLLPLGVLVASALVGAVDDYYNVRRMGPRGGGLRMRHRLGLYTAIALVGALWFYFKLDWDVVRVPFLDTYAIGWWYIPFFVLVIVATAFSVNEADGLDGLAGGALLTSFGAYSAISFLQGRYDLATLCAVISGSILAFLWFNVHPAKFFMGDTGAMALGVTLGVVAMLTNTPFLLLPIGVIFVLESLSVIIQVASKKLRGKKVFLSAPVHHHFEAKGWPEEKVVMRFWMISAVGAIIGTVMAIVDFGILK